MDSRFHGNDKKTRERRNIIQDIYRTYYWEHEVLHTLVILNPSAVLRINSVKDLVLSPNVLHSSRFFAALRMTTIICSR